MTVPILYSFRRCPYAMRARLALVSAGITVEIREILLRDKPLEMLDISPKGTVPVINAAGVIIDESRDIMNWALAQNDPEHWLDDININLIENCESNFKDALDKYKYGSRYDDVNTDEQRGLASAFLRVLDGMLADKNFLGGDKIGFTDIAIVTFVRQFANVDRNWFNAQNWPNLIRWLDDFLQSDRFAFIMQKFPVWHRDQQPIYFPETT